MPGAFRRRESRGPQKPCAPSRSQSRDLETVLEVSFPRPRRGKEDLVLPQQGERLCPAPWLRRQAIGLSHTCSTRHCCYHPSARETQPSLCSG